MKQYEAVIQTLENLGGIATLGNLYKEVFKIKECQWNTRTPFASIRRIVQVHKDIYKIRPGLYALTKYKDRLSCEGIISFKQKLVNEEFNHSYYQGLLLEIGNMERMITYVPPQDKNKLFINHKLDEIAQTTKIYSFSYPHLVNRAKNIDVIWFNDRKMINSLFEIEHSTDIQNSILKYNDLQDFNAKFYIVASELRENEFNRKLDYSAFGNIKARVEFMDYDYVTKWHTKLSELYTLTKLQNRE